MTSEPTQYQLMGPDGFSDIPGAYSTLDQVAKAAARFVLRFVHRGYYRDANMRQLTLEQVADMLTVRELDARMTPTQAYTIYVNDNLERIGRDGWVPVCYEEFLGSEECELLVDQEIRESMFEDSLMLIEEGLLPFDPGRTECPGASPDNGDRARWGESIIEFLNHWGGEPLQDYHYSDAISDLLHAVHKSGFSPAAAIRAALGHFEEETNMEMGEPEEAEATS